VHPQRCEDMPALGEEFRSAREARGLTLSDVAGQIHIRSVYLNAIENEEWTSIGAPVYVRGFIRTYARFLALDGESAVERFNQSSPPEKHTAHAAHTVMSGGGGSGGDRDRSGPSLWVILGSLVAVVLVGFVAYEWWSYSRGGADRVAAGGAQPAARSTGSRNPAPAGASALPSAQPSGGPATPAARHQLAIRLTQRSWLRVTVDGTTAVEGIFPAGTTRTFTGNVADVRAGNAGGVQVSVDGRPSAPMGKEGDVTEQRYTL
jgi:cytoskeleton protein RodZ